MCRVPHVYYKRFYEFQFDLCKRNTKIKSVLQRHLPSCLKKKIKF